VLTDSRGRHLVSSAFLHASSAERHLSPLGTLVLSSKPDR